MKTTAIILTILALSGCSIVRDISRDSCKEATLNAETAREVSTCFLNAWPIHSGLIRGGLGDRINELPAHFLQAMDELDQLALTNDPNDMTDFDKGRVLGLQLRLLQTTIEETLRLYAPRVLSYLPL